MSLTFVANTTLYTVSCSCGGVYAITESHRAQMEKDGKTWTCPYCRCWWGYDGRGANARLERENKALNDRLATERARHDQTKAALEHKERQRRGELAAKTRIKKRVAAGVCPCCSRSFQDLARHMAGQHPQFSTEATT